MAYDTLAHGQGDGAKEAHWASTMSSCSQIEQKQPQHAIHLAESSALGVDHFERGDSVGIGASEACESFQ